MFFESDCFFNCTNFTHCYAQCPRCAQCHQCTQTFNSNTLCCQCPQGPHDQTGATGAAGVPSATGTASRLYGVQMQLTGNVNQILEPGQTLVFDTSLNGHSPDISYNPQNGYFMLNRMGNYFVSWWIATDGSTFTTNLAFALQVNASLQSLGATPIVTGQARGSALVTVDQPLASLHLVNAGPDAVVLASTYDQANIVIIQVS